MSKYSAPAVLLLGMAMIGAALAALPFTVSAREDASIASACPMVETALDRGYGVTRLEARRACAKDND